MTKKILICFLLTSFLNPLQARLTEPGSRDPGDLIAKVDPSVAEAERARVAALYEERTKNAERELYRNAINVLVREASELKNFAATDLVNENTKQVSLIRLKSDLSSARDFVSIPRIDGDFNQERVLNLKESLSTKMKGAMLGYYQSELNFQEEKLLNSLK